MKIPEKPPRTSDLIDAASRSGRLFDLWAVARNWNPSQPYYHWEEMKYRQVPDGITRDEWWLCMKMVREAAYRKLPLVDGANRPFVYSLPDILLRQIHEIDTQAGPGIKTAEPFATGESRDQYITNSLMEEAITSSQLEGAPTTRRVAKEMFLSGRAPRDRGEQMIANNFRAMRFIQEQGNEPLTIDFLLELHRIVTENAIEKEAARGRFRTPDEDIQVVDNEGIVYHRPPATGKELEARMARLVEFANEGAIGPSTGFIAPVLRAVILHFWLAYEHPFYDGNGRIARSLMYWSMLHHGYWLFEFIAISDIIKRAPAQYENAFLYTETDGNDLTYFMLHQVKVILSALDGLKKYIVRRQRELKRLDPLINTHAELNFRQRSLLSKLIRHPEREVSIAGYCEMCSVTYATGRSDLAILQTNGFLLGRKESRSFIYRIAPDALSRLSRAIHRYE